MPCMLHARLGLGVQGCPLMGRARAGVQEFTQHTDRCLLRGVTTDCTRLLTGFLVTYGAALCFAGSVQ